jgi:adenine-specific DNA-methyltransferase
MRERALIKYLGSKRTLVPVILEAVRRASGARSVLDLFSGTSRVGHALKAAGYRVLSNDHNAYAATLARCYVQADAEDVLEDAAKLVREFNARIRGGWSEPGYFTETFCVKSSRFFQPKNGARIDAIREAIAAKGLNPELEAVMLVSLMEAADRVDSTTGLQMAYLKDMGTARRTTTSSSACPTSCPAPSAGKGHATCLDALDAAKPLEADVAYIDPPYNQHSYLGNYHVWESLVRWDKPGGLRHRVQADRCAAAPEHLQQPPTVRRCLRTAPRAVRARTSSSLSTTRATSRARKWNPCSRPSGAARASHVIENDFKRYVGAQIGIYNPQGEKVGKVSHLTEQGIRVRRLSRVSG